jgi:hypothetical protein
MNFSPDYTRDLGFLGFKREINHPLALEFVFNLCSRCHIGRTKELTIPDERFADALGLPEGIDPNVAKQALLKNGLIEEIPERPGTYVVHVFAKHNAGLRACWANGALGGRKSQADSLQAAQPAPHRPVVVPHAAAERDVEF